MPSAAVKRKRWWQFWKKKGGAEERLVSAIGEAAFRSAESLKSAIAEAFGKGTKEATLKWIAAVLEFLVFFMHQVNRFAYTQLGQEKRTALQEAVGPIVIKAVIDTLAGDWPEEMRGRILAEVSDAVNLREIEYGACVDFYLPPEEDPIVNEDLSFRKPRAAVNQLAVNIAKSVFDSRLTLSIYATLVGVVMDSMKRHNFSRLVVEVGKVL